MHKNPSEQFVTRIAERTFLKFWSFPNVYRRDRAIPKEICDLLIVYGDIVMIISVKHTTFKMHRGVDVAWKQWYQRAVHGSAKQLIGAERYLMDRPDEVYRDHTCSATIPVPIPSLHHAKFYRVVIALGISSACRSVLPERSGSLYLCPQLMGKEHAKHPFQIGSVLPDSGFIHVFDDASFEMVLRELDTVTDFSEYLDERCKLLSSNRIAVCEGEENLLAGYLRHRAGTGDRFGLPPTKKKIHIVDGGWDRLVSDAQYAARRQLDRHSYVWDDLIDLFWRSAHGDLSSQAQVSSPSDAERIARYMAAERRFGRRMLCNSIRDLLRNAPSDMISRRFMQSPIHAPRVYAFLVMPRLNWSEVEYREERRSVLRDFTFVSAYMHRDEGLPVIGIAMEHPNNKCDSFDASLTEIAEWTPEIVAEAEWIRKERGYFRPDMRKTYSHDDEFPDINIVCRGGEHTVSVGRNSPCPCGSGRKYKKCCGSVH